MSKPLKEDYIIRIKSRIEQHVKEPVEQEEKEEFVELMTRGQREALKAFEDSLKDENYEKRKSFFKNLKDRFMS